MDSIKPKLVVLTGAGMSAESGISTFRDSGGLWDKYPVMDVASAEGFARNPALIHKFYNERRHELVKAQPNAGHSGLAELEQWYDTWIITQNVDNLHERAGSRNVLHLHGELMKLRSVIRPEYTETLTPDNLDSSPDTRGRNGDPMRPHIVFFGEAVPEIDTAMRLAASADIFVVIGTSLNVYPAAGLMRCVRPGTPVYYIDPDPAPTPGMPDIRVMAVKATEGMRMLDRELRGI